MKTTIQVEKETLLKLKTLKLAKRESYEEIINRLIIHYQKSKNQE